jgi:predicted RNA polymerase sigma factor
MIGSLYDTLMTIRPSLIVALNQAIAVAQIEGPECGLKESASIAGRERASLPIHSTAVRWASLSFDAEGLRRRASTSRQRSL